VKGVVRKARVRSSIESPSSNVALLILDYHHPHHVRNPGQGGLVRVPSQWLPEYNYRTSRAAVLTQQGLCTVQESVVSPDPALPAAAAAAVCHGSVLETETGSSGADMPSSAGLIGTIILVIWSHSAAQQCRRLSTHWAALRVHDTI
jgi:hypothetical protein